MKYINSINLFALIAIPLSLWLLVTNRIDIWVLVLVYLFQIRLDIIFKK